MAKKNKKVKFPIDNSRNGKNKREIREMLNHLGISKTYFKKTMPSVSGSSTDFIRKSRGEGGRKPSLHQQKILLRQLITADGEMRKQMESQKDHIKNDQSAKSAMQEQAGETLDKEVLKGLVSSVFDRDR
jgi:hypothetical protein